MLSRAEIVDELLAIEPHLARLAAVADRADVDTVEALTRDPNARIRANAITLMSLIDPPSFWRLLPQALDDPEVLVRMQSVRSLENFAAEELEQNAQMVARALGDADSGIRKFSARAVANLTAAPVRQALENMAASDRESFVRDEAARALRSAR
jgi:HEAT repeat protein